MRLFIVGVRGTIAHLQTKCIHQSGNIFEFPVGVDATLCDLFGIVDSQHARDEHCLHSSGACAAMLIATAVAHEERIARAHPNRFKSMLVDSRIRLADAELV